MLTRKTSAPACSSSTNLSTVRQDNADRRLTPLGYRLGLVDADRWQRLQQKEAAIACTLEKLENYRIGDVSLEKYLRRPEVEWSQLIEHLPELADVPAEVAEQVVYDVKYAGYVARQQEQVARQQRLAEKVIPASLDYATIRQLRTEAREKLARIRPLTLAQASRISGITPADVALVLAHIEGRLARS